MAGGARRQLSRPSSLTFNPPPNPKPLALKRSPHETSGIEDKPTRTSQQGSRLSLSWDLLRGLEEEKGCLLGCLEAPRGSPILARQTGRSVPPPPRASALFNIGGEGGSRSGVTSPQPAEGQPQSHLPSKLHLSPPSPRARPPARARTHTHTLTSSLTPPALGSR